MDVFIDAMVAFCEEPFDSLDSKCFYNSNLDRRSNQMLHIQTILILASVIDISKFQTNCLKPFTQKLLDVYSDKPKRMVQCKYSDLLPNIPAPSLREANEDVRHLIHPVQRVRQLCIEQQLLELWRH